MLFCSQLIFSQDIWPPDVPKLDTVSVYDFNTGAVIISWYPSDSSDVAGYRIYRSINTLWQPIADVPAPATSYIDNSATSNFHPELYRIAAYDEVENLSAMTPENKYHNTIYVFPYQDSVNCVYAIRLNWNRYLNWEEGVKEYRIYVSENFSPFTLLATNSGNTNQYFHMNVNDNTSYCYIIRAISNNYRTSTSNKTCFFTDLPNLPTFIKADYATVEDKKIKLSFTLDPQATICRYRLQRSTDGVNFDPISFLNQCDNKYTYTDANVNVEKRYYYQLVAIDQCNQARLYSNIASNIVIYTSSNDEVQSVIKWNRYQNWLSEIDSVYLYRIIDGESNYELIYSSVNTYDTLKLDDLSNIALHSPAISNKFCYYVEQVERSNQTTANKSKSNISCTYQTTRIFVPNTFTPDGDNLNNTFKPIITFIDKEGYVFKIFDRWGFLVFQTTDVTIGWDGKIGDKLCQPGMYTYYFLYKTIDGQIKERSGVVYVYFP